jgi:hypothetical protein
MRRVPATAWTSALPLASIVAAWSGETLATMSTLPAMSSAARVEASGMTRQTMRSKPGVARA